MSNDAQDERDEQDERVLELRENRRSFAAIARIVGYERASEATAAFHRALRRRPAKEQESLRRSELARLDAMATRVRQDGTLAADDAARKLGVVEGLRALLLAP